MVKPYLESRHPIPTIEEVLNDLNGVNSVQYIRPEMGFSSSWNWWRVTRQITTFIAHRGLFRYKRLMFRIASAPEKYQKIIKDALTSCKGVANIADDLPIHGRWIKEHDKNLLTVLREYGLTWNAQKCHFRLPKLTFFGHSLSCDGISPSAQPQRMYQRCAHLYSWCSTHQSSSQNFHKWLNLC